MAIIVVNGKKQEVKKGISVLELIEQNNVAQPEMVSVQVNENFIAREDYTLQLNEGDQVDFLYFMGGGAR